MDADKTKEHNCSFNAGFYVVYDSIGHQLILRLIVDCRKELFLRPITRQFDGEDLFAMLAARNSDPISPLKEMCQSADDY